jgi:hypothetical protein
MKQRLIWGVFLIPLIVLLVACGSTTTPSGPQEVQVTLSNTIASSVSTFTPGMPYHFVVTNTSQHPYEFLLIPMGMNVGHMSRDQMRHAALYMVDTIAPGETKTFDYTF